MKTKERLFQLRQELHGHNHAYHVLNAPQITDEVYDQLFKELKELEVLFPEHVDANSPTARVGGASIDTFAKTKHTYPMLSLDNTFTAQEVVAFFNSKCPGNPVLEAVVEPKIDGLSLSLTYEKGQLVKAVTRGDGTTGDDVTANARTIFEIPLVLQRPVSIEVRGEVYMPRDQFDKLNAQLEKEGDEPFANPRNAAAGSMKRKNPDEVAARGLAFIAYNAPSKVGVDTHMDMLNLLYELGFFTVLYRGLSTVNVRSEVEVANVITRYAANRDHYEFDIDGLVFKLNDRQLQAKLSIGTRSPNWATSYKFPPEQKTTKLLGITVQVGRLGTLTPVAELAPVSLAGTVVKRASLHNGDEINRLQVNIGDEVTIQKAAEIIPQVVGVAKKLSTGVWAMPTKCPCCGHAVEKVPNQVAIRCKNPVCEDQVFARLEHAVKKQSLDIDGCGEQTIRALMAHGVKSLLGLFTISDVGFLGDAASKRFLKSREKAKAAPLWRKLHAFGIDGLGITTSKELANRWNSLADMIDAMDEVAKVLGPVSFENFKAYIGDEAKFREILDMMVQGVLFEEEKKTGAMTGKCFCITGGMVSGSREEVSARIEALGGSVKSSVSKKVHYLVVGEGAGLNKSAAATRMGTKCITEQELYAMMGVPMPTPELDDLEA